MYAYSIVIKPGIQKIPGSFLFLAMVSLFFFNACVACAAPVDHWPAFRDSMFAGKVVANGAQFIQLHLPATAENPALVPVSFDISRPGIKRAWLMVDGNPIPLTAIFEFHQELPVIHIETRIRLEKSTFVHLVVETREDDLYVAQSEIKTPGGGCGGGMDGDETKLRAEAGSMKLRAVLPEVPEIPGGLTLLIKHPMRTGFERTSQGYYAKPWYLKRLNVSLNDKLFMNIDLGVGISADPWFSLPYIYGSVKTGTVSAQDNEGNFFKQNFQLPSNTGDE
jgi:sulfur-oxidizing protein SoxY